MNVEIGINGDRLWQSIMEMAKIDALPQGGCGRLALSDGDRVARDLFRHWATQAGCSVSWDDMGNMFAKRAGGDPTLPPVCIGSHLDTQPEGGKFDGVFGVMAGLEIVRTLNDHQIETQAPIEVVNWTNEEGARFAPAMLCSSVFAGIFDPDFANSREDNLGKRFDCELNRIGYRGQQKCGEHAMLAFLEAHIEQGPVLEKHDQVIGIVTGGQGQRWYNVKVQGHEAHSGSTPMAGRKDALITAAKILLEVQRIASKFGEEGVGTVGELHVVPNSRNTIPGTVRFTIDLRHPDDAVLTRMDQDLGAFVDNLQAEATSIELDMIWHNPPIVFDRQCVDAVQQATEKLGYSHRRMISGAGHDACQVARKVPTAMVFVPCKDGLSHNQAESAKPEHLEAGCNVLLQAALALSLGPKISE